MSTYRFILEPYKGMNSRYHCPKCVDKEKTFTRYIDSETGEYLDPNVGRCNREVKCGYHYTPRQYFQDHDLPFESNPSFYQESKQIIRKAPSFIPHELMEKSFIGYDQNNFITWLYKLFGQQAINGVLKKYNVGTSKHWPGSTIFWQVDSLGKVRGGKIMLYNPDTGKRIKEPFNHVTWVHKVLQIADFSLSQCFFGENLLTEKSKKVAIVESEKSAIIASLFFPDYIWLATGGLSNLNYEKCKVLEGRTVILYPDLKAFDKWDQKRIELSRIMPGLQFSISDFLEKNASEQEKEAGWDVADYLINYPLNPASEEEKILHEFSMKNPTLSKLIHLYDLDIDKPIPSSVQD